MGDRTTPEIDGILRKHMIRVPKEIDACSGIRIFGKLIRSIVFTTDIAIIRNCNANAVIAVYPFTPQPTNITTIITARQYLCIEAGANAITYTPPSSAEIFKVLMNKYRAEH